MHINTGAIASALRPGVREFFGNMYSRHPLECKEIFETHSSDMNFERDVNVHGFGLGVVKPEGTAITYDTLAQGFKKEYQHITYALGFKITQEAMEDNLYMKLAKANAEKLALSMKQTKETVAANVLNRAFNSAYTGADGLELCSDAHLLSKGGTFQNELSTSADLSEASLEQMMIDIAGAVDDAGLKMALQGRKLIIPRQLEFKASRILKSDLRVATANNDINVLKSGRYLPEGFVVNHYLTDADAFFIKTDAAHGMLHFERSPLVIDQDMEFDTNNVCFKARERYSFGWTDPRGIYGSPGA